MTSSIQVSELAAIIREHMFPLEYVTLQRPDIVRSENAARAILAMRSKDHSIAGDDVREALAILNDSSKPTPDRVREAKAILTAIGSQSIEGEGA